MEAENMEFPPSSFDLVTSITVLQHITDGEAFSRAIGNIRGVVKTGGHICVMDFSPIKVKDRRPASYLIIRSRKEYVQAFENNGCRLICEFGLPRIGVRLYRVISKAMAKAAKLLLRARTSGAKENNTERESIEPPESILLRVYNMVGRITLKLAKPLDNFLFPFPSRYTDMRILVFVKAVR
jgi:ubiquinone/menaquinone biosynthesis C-methylase UbiE